MTKVEPPKSATSVPPPERSSRFGVRHVMVAIALIAVLLVALRYCGIGLVVFLFITFSILLIGAVVVGVLRLRSTQQDGLLSVLTIAAERDLPLSPGASAFAGLCSSGFRRRIAALSYLLDSGVALPEALANVPGLLPRGATALACVGWVQHALGLGLREALTAQENRRAFRARFIGKLAYMMALIVVMQTIGGFIMYFIIPKFEAIFADFGVDLPWVTRVVITASHLFIKFGWFFFPLELAVGVAIVLGFFGVIGWRVPGTDWLLRRRDTAAVLRALAITVEANQPITAGMASLEKFYPVPRVRRNLNRALVLMEHGVPWSEALVERGLLRRSDLDVIAAAERAGNLPWALRTLADGAERRLGYRLAMFAQFLLPIIVLAAGSLVLLVAVGCFTPLVILIERLAG